MGVDIPKISYSGSIKEIQLGTGDKALKAGGANSYPYYTFEGTVANKTVIAMEVVDIDPTGIWPEALLKVYGDVVNDKGAWAKRCVEFGAQMIHVGLPGIDPNGEDRTAEQAIEVIKAVVDAVDVPVAVWGCNNPDKDAEVLKAVAEAFHGKKLMIGPCQEANHKQLGAAIIGFKHTAINSTPIDINLAKQLNVLTGNLGVPDENILIDPTTGGLGYGMEYSYSVMERARMAALVQQDEKLQFPLYNVLANEVWKVKEASLEDEKLGDAETRGILMESIAATSMILAGSDILVLRHPETVKRVKALIETLS